MTNKQPAYFNKAQLYVHEISPNSKCLVCARRFGKSDGVMGPDILYDIQHMPKSTGWIYGATFKQLLARTLPATEAFWRRYNYRRDFHYFIGRKAPKNMNFKLPLIEPMEWDKCIHWYNGSVIHLLSQDVKFAANSLTADWGKVDEARSIRKEKMFEEAIPTLSGTSQIFSSCHKWKGLTIVSDMPTSRQGQWILDLDKRHDPQLFEVIENIIAQLNDLAFHYSSMPEIPRNVSDEIKSLKDELLFYRSKAFMYKEFDTIENIELLGVDYIAKMKRDLPPVTFQISIMNKKMRKLDSLFYPSLDASIHYYDAYKNDYLLGMRTSTGSLDMDAISQTACLADGDIDPSVPLAIAFDYNAAINWVATGQRNNTSMKTLSSFYVKSPHKIRELCNNWCAYYEALSNRDVIFYFNTSALDKGYADEESESFADIIYNILTSHNWNVDMVNIGKPWKHSIKHQYIDDALKGKNYLFPTFNKDKNPDLLLALEGAGIKIGRSGFEKDKTGEKHQDSEDNPMELRTDGTDAWDDLFIGLNFFPRQYSHISFVTKYS